MAALSQHKLCVCNVTGQCVRQLALLVKPRLVVIVFCHFPNGTLAVVDAHTNSPIIFVLYVKHAIH